MDMRSPIREVTVQKGAQVGATVGILENVIGYVMSHVKNAPVLMLTADAELAKLRMESYITPMIQQSGLQDLVKSADEVNVRKTGKTDVKVEWIGGGFLIPLGSRNPAKLRSVSIQYLLEDEIDGYPDEIGKDGLIPGHAARGGYSRLDLAREVQTTPDILDKLLRKLGRKSSEPSTHPPITQRLKNGDLFITNYEKRQRKPPSAEPEAVAERQKKFRENVTSL